MLDPFLDSTSTDKKMKVAVIDSNKQPLEPCHPAVARNLLKRGEAAIWRKYPFTIILKRAVPTQDIVTRNYTLCWDPGSKTSGIAIVSDAGDIIYAATLQHRGAAIKKALSTRSGFRRGRRTRNLRYRPARWANRKRKVPVLTEEGWTYSAASMDGDSTKSDNTFNRVSKAKFLDNRYRWERLPDTKSNKNQKKRWRRIRLQHERVADNGWIAPSLMSRVYNLETWTRRLCSVYPISQLAIETVKFDVHLLQKPDIHGIEYQQGTLHGREIREYLLELTGRKCAYCGKGNQRLEVEHIFPKGPGGSNRPDNLTMACKSCNEKKGKLHGKELEEKLGVDFAKKVTAASRKSKKGLKDATAVNTIRWKLYETLKATGLPVLTGTGGKTAYHRNLAGLPKTHYYDAASVALVPKQPKKLTRAVIKAVGYGTRDNVGKMFDMKAPGFTKPSTKVSHADGFAKFDHVEMTKKSGIRYKGVINCFDKTPEGKPRKLRLERFAPDEKDPRKGGNTSELRLIQKRDGYSYAITPAASEFRTPKQPSTEIAPGTQLEFTFLQDKK